MQQFLGLIPANVCDGDDRVRQSVNDAHTKDVQNINIDEKALPKHTHTRYKPNENGKFVCVH